MNDIDKMPSKCRDCPYWELAVFPWCCGDCTDRLKKPNEDFVSRQWLIDEYHRRHEGPPGGAMKMIEEAPAAEVEPKRKTGYWFDLHVSQWVQYGAVQYKCSECGNDVMRKTKYCEECGAKMDGKPSEGENNV